MAASSLLSRALGKLRAGDAHEAIRLCRRVLHTDPNHAEALHLLGLALLDQPERLVPAVRYLVQATRLQPDDPERRNNLGVGLYRLGRFRRAAAQYRRALEQRRNFPEAWRNLGDTLMRLGEPQPAAEAYRQALVLRPEWPEVYVCLGAILHDAGLLDDAKAAFDRAVLLRPDHAMTHLWRAIIFLKRGQLKAGWREYEWRFEATVGRYPPAGWWQPRWDGSPFRGQTLMVSCEQGIGDAIQFARYLPMVKALGGRVVLRCHRSLRRLFESLAGVDALIDMNDESGLPEQPFDLHIPLLSLPGLFGTELESIPAQVPYLRVDPSLTSRWRERLEAGEFKVGLVWSGNPSFSDNRRRSCSLAAFAPLSRVPGVAFYSLQVGPASEQAAHPPAGMSLIDWTGELGDFADTAALIMNIDLVVTVDTSVAHLAGALGRPVWTLLWVGHCWRYLLERTDSPWYPTMRLFRQPRPGDWSSVMGEVARSLERVVPTEGPRQRCDDRAE